MENGLLDGPRSRLLAEMAGHHPPRQDGGQEIVMALAGDVGALP